MTMTAMKVGYAWTVTFASCDGPGDWRDCLTIVNKSVLKICVKYIDPASTQQAHQVTSLEVALNQNKDSW